MAVERTRHTREMSVGWMQENPSLAVDVLKDFAEEHFYFKVDASRHGFITLVWDKDFQS